MLAVSRPLSVGGCHRLPVEESPKCTVIDFCVVPEIDGQAVIDAKAVDPCPGERLSDDSHVSSRITRLAQLHREHATAVSIRGQRHPHDIVMLAGRRFDSKRIENASSIFYLRFASTQQP